MLNHGKHSNEKSLVLILALNGVKGKNEGGLAGDRMNGDSAVPRLGWAPGLKFHMSGGDFFLITVKKNSPQKPSMRSSCSLLFRQLNRCLAQSPKSPLSPAVLGSNTTVVGSAATFDKNFPSPKAPKKAWDGQNKDDFFRDKYAHVHVKQKKNQEAKLRESKGKKPLSPYKAARSFSKNKSRRIPDGELDKKPRPKPKKVEKEDEYELMLENPHIEYVFGTQAVAAALQNPDRHVSRLFTQDEAHLASRKLIELAEDRNVPVIYDVPKVKLNQMAKNGVHNRYVIETRPLMITDITSMSQYSTETQSYSVTERAQEPLEFKLDLQAPDKKSFPLGLFIDQVTDVHNFGAILRSAYFLGIDFVTYCDKDCAKLSPVVGKTSSGALDYINLFNVPRPVDFFSQVQANGWQIIASTVTSKPNKLVLPSQLSELLETGPCILLLGSEGEGLRKGLIDMSDFAVTLEGAQDRSKVDSLNVSVASALLLSKFYKDEAFDI